MQAVKARAPPELTVRKLLRELGAVGYRLQRAELPGNPNIAFVGRRKAIFVHGCFWHGHGRASGRRIPKANAAYWIGKIARNKTHDIEYLQALSALGWSCLVVWECDLKSLPSVRRRLVKFLIAEKAAVPKRPRKNSKSS